MHRILVRITVGASFCELAQASSGGAAQQESGRKWGLGQRWLQRLQQKDCFCVLFGKAADAGRSSNLQCAAVIGSPQVGFLLRNIAN